MKTIVATREVDEEGLAELRRPQDHFVRERAAGPDRFEVETGPFTRWERRVDIEPGPDGSHRATTTVVFDVAVPLWGWTVEPFIAFNLRRTGGRGARTWWMPALMDARSTAVIGILAPFALFGGYLGTLLSQTNTYFREEFGASASQVADALIAVRIGAFAALGVVALADRLGRRRVLLVSTVLGMVLTATGAVSPSLLGITVSQGIARVFSTAMALIIVVMAAEEVAAGARASAQSVLAMVAGLGAGGVVLFLLVAGLAPGAWRALYLVPLPFLAAVPALARRLPETRRFEVFDLATTGDAAAPGLPSPRGRARAAGVHEPSRYRRNLVLVGSMLLLFSLFITPWNGVTNDFLRLERGFAGWQLVAFQLLTNAPAGVTIVIGGLLADRYGRHLIGALGFIGGTVAGVAMFLTDGWAIWVSATAAVVLGGLLVPTVLVYPTELFPTARRGRAQGYTALLGVAGSVIGLKVCGVLADAWGSYAGPITLLGLAPLLAAVLVLVWIPETSGIELEELNPGDLPPPTGEDLAALDRRWEDRAAGGRHLAVHERDARLTESG